MQINGKTLRDSIISAANAMANQKKLVDELNVFPVPDGDTGTNMSMTIGAALKVMYTLEDDVAVSQVASSAASAMLRGARGNSGVITSLLFRGFSKALEGKEEMSAKDLAAALTTGVQGAYKAVMNPTEGTILTVSRLAAAKGSQVAQENDDPKAVIDAMIKEGEVALAQTPELLPVLKKAGVVDAGGKGFLVILEGMKQVFDGGEIVPSNTQVDMKMSDEDFKHQTAEYDLAFDPTMTNTYCTEFLVNKSPDVGEGEALKLRAFLESLGDSIVTVDDDDIIKVHVHTGDPGRALQEGAKYGFLTGMKIENMLEQYNERRRAEGKPEFRPDKMKETAKEMQGEHYVPVSGEHAFGFVAVVAGAGLEALFTDLGANHIVTGGQTMNPSTDDILNAVHAVDAKTVFVLPNNKNIILAAEQAVPLADRNIIVLQTTTIPAGMAAMLAFDESKDAKENAALMTQAIDSVATGLITYAARDSNFENHKIKKGQLLAMNGSKLAFTETDLNKTVLKLTKTLARKSSSFVTLIAGEDITDEQLEELESYLAGKLPEQLEVNFLRGDQPVYYFIISVE